MRRRDGWRQIFAGCVAALLMGSVVSASAASAKAVGSPEVRSAVALVMDANNGEILFQREATRVVPIASLTKLMTALVVLDGLQPLDEVIKITAEDRWKGKGAHSRLPTGAKLTRADLLKLSLMASENLAARTLARNYPGGLPAFVRTMNLKAKALGMTKTRFADASGLSNLNVSNARDLAKLVKAASRISTISDYSTLAHHEVRVGKGVLGYRNTNLLIGKDDWTIHVQKTGFTNDAGQCLVMEAVIADRPVVMVFLNSFGKLTRTADARRIRKWMEAQKSPALAGAGDHARK
jgi:D-alanyl-D-alanine endopeptidase (penicillin-binding protein 7)